MSWLKGLQGNEPDRYVEPEDTPKVADPAIANRNVSTKSANQPFLAYVLPFCRLLLVMTSPVDTKRTARSKRPSEMRGWNGRNYGTKRLHEAKKLGPKNAILQKHMR